MTNHFRNGLMEYQLDINVDSTLCRTLLEYLRGNEDKLIDSDAVSNYISKVKNQNKENSVISLFGGLEIKYAYEKLLLEYAEPYFNPQTGVSGDQVIQLAFSEDGVAFAKWDNLPKREKNHSLLLETMPFDKERLNVVINYLSEIYNEVKKENKTR